MFSSDFIFILPCQFQIGLPVGQLSLTYRYVNGKRKMKRYGFADRINWPVSEA
jgi:hypothetical protein